MVFWVVRADFAQYDQYETRPDLPQCCCLWLDLLKGAVGAKHLADDPPEHAISQRHHAPLDQNRPKRGVGVFGVCVLIKRPAPASSQSGNLLLRSSQLKNTPCKLQVNLCGSTQVTLWV